MKKEDYEMTGWGCFFFGCMFFLIDGLKSENGFIIVGSLLFFIGCSLLAKPVFFPEE